MGEPTRPDIDADRDRNATPLERTIRMIATCPEVHDRMAFHLWLYASDYWGNGQRGLVVWDAMSANDKAPWLDRVMDRYEAMRAMTPAQIAAENRLHMRGIIKRNDEVLRASSPSPERPK